MHKDLEFIIINALILENLFSWLILRVQNVPYHDGVNGRDTVRGNTHIPNKPRMDLTIDIDDAKEVFKNDPYC